MDICIYPVDICIYPVDICIYPVDICIYPVDICIYPSFDDQFYSDFLPKRHPICFAKIREMKDLLFMDSACKEQA